VHRHNLQAFVTLATLTSVALCGAGFGLPGVRAEDEVKPRDKEAIHYDSDGLKITGLLSKPAGKGPFPLILVNHAGYDPAKKVGNFLDLFVKQGYVSLASDYRGCGQSEGNHELAKGEVNDVINAIRYAKALPYVDGKRVVLWGFSHGAAISLLAASRNDSIKAVVALQGPIELADCYQYWVKNQDKPGVKPLVGVSVHVGGTPEKIPEAWKERSALYVAQKIKCPVLLIYGDKDDAVPADQGERMEKALKGSGNLAVKLIVVKGANHGLNKKGWGEVLKPMVNFLNRQVGLPELP